jgi:hypothetical protein
MRTLIFTAALTLVSAGAFAQDFTAEQRAACKGDYEAFCKGTIPGGGRALACLKKNEGKLSAACKKMVEAQK